MDSDLERRQDRSIRILMISLGIFMASAFSTMMFVIIGMWASELEEVPVQWIILMTIIPVLVYIAFDAVFRYVIKRIRAYTEDRRNDRRRPPAEPSIMYTWLAIIFSKE